VATFTERVQVIIDFVERKSGAGSPLAQLKTDVAQAEGAMGKLKAAGSGLGGVLSSVGPQAWAAAGVAAAGFMVKSAQAFEELALSASKFGTATGMAVDEASRWIEVGGDVGVSADTMQSAFSKLAATVQKSPDALSKFGIELAKTRDGAVDMNGTVLNVIEALNKMDPAKRAAAMKEIFGKGAVGAAELFGMKVEDIRQRLADVSDQKVIDEDEQRKAERLRDAVDTLKDAWDNVVLSVGESVAELAPILEMVGAIADKAQSLGDVWGVLQDTLNPVQHGVEMLGQAWDFVTGKSDDAKASGVDATTAIATGADDAKQSIDDIGAAWDAVHAKFDAQRQVLDVQDAFDKLQASAVAAAQAYGSQAQDASQKEREHQREILNTKDKVAKYAEEVLKLPPEAITQILAEIDNGSLTSAEHDLNNLARQRKAEILVKTVLQNTLSFLPGRGPVVTGTGVSASAQPSARGLGAAEPMSTPIAVQAAVPISVQVNLPTGADESRTVAALHRWTGRNGSLLNAGVWTG